MNQEEIRSTLGRSFRSQSISHTGMLITDSARTLLRQIFNRPNFPKSALKFQGAYCSGTKNFNIIRQKTDLLSLSTEGKYLNLESSSKKETLKIKIWRTNVLSRQLSFFIQLKNS